MTLHQECLSQEWRPIGATGMVCFNPPSEAEGREVIRVTATDHFTGARRDLPAVPGDRLYKITGRVRAELTGTTKALVGIDYLDKEGRFIRQATTRALLAGASSLGTAQFQRQIDVVSLRRVRIRCSS